MNWYIHSPDQIPEALKKTDVSLIKALSISTKLPEPTILRLIDLIVYSHMESKSSNQKVHKEFRILVKKRAYIRYMKQDAELFKGKREELEANAKGLVGKGNQVEE